MDIVKIAALCIVSAVLCKLFNSENSEYGLYIKLAAAMLIMTAAVIYAAPVIETINSIFLRSGIESEHISILFRSLGICYIAQLASDICRDSGESALATQAELAGKISLIITALPLVKNLTDIVAGLT